MFTSKTSISGCSRSGLLKHSQASTRYGESGDQSGLRRYLTSTPHRSGQFNHTAVLRVLTASYMHLGIRPSLKARPSLLDLIRAGSSESIKNTGSPKSGDGGSNTITGSKLAGAPADTGVIGTGTGTDSGSSSSWAPPGTPPGTRSSHSESAQTQVAATSSSPPESVRPITGRLGGNLAAHEVAPTLPLPNSPSTSPPSSPLSPNPPPRSASPSSQSATSTTDRSGYNTSISHPSSKMAPKVLRRNPHSPRHAA